ncbi:MAG: hypothetical protein ABIO04_09795 [Ferruginibacter sp.]
MDVSRSDRWIIFGYVCLNIFIVAAVRIDPGFGMQLLQEDQFVENITSIALFLGAIYVLYKCVKNISSKNYLAGFFQLFVAFALIFMAGEEISWGQRIFHWQTTGLFKKDNLQGETNFHNLKINGVKLNKVIFTYAFTAIGAFVFVICPYLYKKYTGFKNFVNQFGCPLPGYKHSLFLLIGLLFVLLIPDESKKWELWECDAALIIFWTMIRPLNLDVIYRRFKG